MEMDLLAPLGAEHQLKQNYVHQLRQTINAYLPTYIFVGEALQNALDAIRERGGGPHKIDVTLDFNERQVTVRDTGSGFPDRPGLLFLGGGEKAGKGLAGMVGVGLKVVLFSSCEFRLQSRNKDGAIRVDLLNAHQFADAAPPTISLPNREHLTPDPDSPFPEGTTGTEISYRFPTNPDGVPEQFLRDVWEECFPRGAHEFGQSLADAVKQKFFTTRLAALFAAYLRRFTYLGSTQDRPEFDKLTVSFTVKGSPDSLKPLSDFADNKSEVTFDVTPRYLNVRDTLQWTTPPKPVLLANALGEGGTNISRANNAFNVTTYSRQEEYESLLVNARSRPSPDVDMFRRLLFPKLNKITLTIGRIPAFRRFLPGESRRVISARGVVTQHDLDIIAGQNQQYVRTFDIVFDVDADLNYGKTQLTDMHLVANIRRFANEAYRSTIQNAARNFVGREKEENTEVVKFWDREDLGIADLRQLKVPRDENDVIALFFELTGLGHFQDIGWYGLSSKDTYDGRVTFDLNGRDPTAHDLRAVEFKLRGASIARDFDRDEKNIKDVDLVICYEIDVPPIDNFQVVPFESSAIFRTDRIPYPGVTHVLYDGVSGKEVQLLPLRNYLASAFPPDQPPPTPEDAEETD